MAKKEDYSAYSLEDLKYDLESATVKHKKMKFDHATTGLQNPQSLVEVRRDIARIKTELRAREIAGMSEEQLENRSKIRTRRKRQK